MVKYFLTLLVLAVDQISKYGLRTDLGFLLPKERRCVTSIYLSLPREIRDSSAFRRNRGKAGKICFAKISRKMEICDKTKPRRFLNGFLTAPVSRSFGRVTRSSLSDVGISVLYQLKCRSWTLLQTQPRSNV